MKAICILILSLTFVACSSKKASNAVIDAFGPIPGAGATGNDYQVDAPASGKINGSEFKVRVGYIFNNPFNGQMADLFLIDQHDMSVNCDQFHDFYVILPIKDKTNIIGKTVVASGDFTFENSAVFYDIRGSTSYSANVNKNQGMMWQIENDGTKLKGWVTIPADSGEDKNYVTGYFPVINCL